MAMKWILGLLVIGLTVWWGVKNFAGGLPGEAVADMGREHVPSTEGINYNSNPPTSGPHLSSWERKGFIETPLSDGEMIHSLEHGYVVVSFDCTMAQSLLVKPVLAHVDEGDADSDENVEATESSQDTSLNGLWQSEGCEDLRGKLGAFYDKNNSKRLIIAPRGGLDRTIAVTAWTRIEKMDDFEEKRLQRFLDVWENKGPEKTVE